MRLLGVGIGILFFFFFFFFFGELWIVLNVRPNIGLRVGPSF